MIEFMQLAALTIGLAGTYALIMTGGTNAVLRSPRLAILTAAFLLPIFLIWCAVELFMEPINFMSNSETIG